MTDIVWAGVDTLNERHSRGPMLMGQAAIGGPATRNLSRAALDRVCCAGSTAGVQVAWLTTRSPGQVRWLIEGPLRGKLAGPYVSHRNWPRPGWRQQSLVSFVRDRRPAVVAWVDDRVDVELAPSLAAMTEIPTMIIRPDKNVGLQLADVDAITRFLERPQSS